jgi:hypothetical protein
MTNFSNKFNNKLVKSHKKRLDGQFNSLGTRVKEIGLPEEKEKVIIGILDDAYTEKHLKIHKQAAEGTLPPISDPDEEMEGVDEEPAGDGSEALESLLGGGSTETVDDGKTAIAEPAKPVAPATTAKTGGKGGNKGGGKKK